MADVNAALEKWCDWSAYPQSWPRRPDEKRPLGVLPLTTEIEQVALRRLETIRADLSNAGKFYPRDEVRRALQYWNIPSDEATR